MRLFVTELRAIDPLTGELCLYEGELIHAPSFELAQEFCNKNGKGYLTVTHEYEGEEEFDSDITQVYTVNHAILSKN